jgi:ABC-type multidrug transport system ATPase subunit
MHIDIYTSDLPTKFDGFHFQSISGLDSVSSLQVIKHLKALAHEHNIAVIAIIHQPSSSLFQLFDDVYVMSHGECLYGGPLDNMLTAFEDAGYACPNYYNRADFGEYFA